MLQTVIRMRRFAATVVAVGALSAVAACGTSEAGAAAVVGDRRITVAQVQQATTEIQAYLGAGTKVSQRQVLFLMITSPYLVRLLDSAGAGVSESDARADLAAKPTAADGTSITHPDPATLDTWRANLVIQRLNGLQQAQAQTLIAQFKSQIAATHVVVNPRYGTFDAAKLGIVDATQNWLSTPAPSATATP